MAPGVKTPAFWLAALATVLTYLLGSDVLGAGKDVQVGALVLTSLGSIGYVSWRAFAKKDGEKKPAWRTSEFWLSAAAALCGGLYAAGAFGPDSSAGKLLGGAMAVLAALGYAVQSDTKPKAPPTE